MAMSTLAPTAAPAGSCGGAGDGGKSGPAGGAQLQEPEPEPLPTYSSRATITAEEAGAQLQFSSALGATVEHNAGMLELLGGGGGGGEPAPETFPPPDAWLCRCVAVQFGSSPPLAHTRAHST
jgi:hypothetical protein